jgi:hypothetical protein
MIGNFNSPIKHDRQLQLPGQTRSATSTPRSNTIDNFNSLIKHDRQLQLPDQTRSATSTHSAMHLDEGKLFVQLGENGGGDGAHWILDSGATNHMTGMRAVFSEIDLRVHSTVRYGDGSVTNIEGRGTILIKCKTGGHKNLMGVYYILRLKANIVSLGQMEEAGYKIVLESGFLKL